MKSMNTTGFPNIDESFYGSVTVGERGQVVVPAEARQEMGISPGDKLLVMRHPLYQGLVMFKIDAARAFMDDFERGLRRAAEEAQSEKETSA